MAQTSCAAVPEVFGDHGPVIARFPVGHQAGGALDAGLRAVPKQRAPEEAKARTKLRPRWLQSAAHRHVDAVSARDAWRQRLPP